MIYRTGDMLAFISIDDTFYNQSSIIFSNIEWWKILIYSICWVYWLDLPMSWQWLLIRVIAKWSYWWFNVTRYDMSDCYYLYLMTRWKISVDANLNYHNPSHSK